MSKMIRAVEKSETRTAEQIRQQYKVEKRLAARLMNASAEERKDLYSVLYEELYRLVPHHRQLAQIESPEKTRLSVARQMKKLSRFLGVEKSFLEIGPGDCALSLEVARRVRMVYAVDVTRLYGDGVQLPPNFEFLLSDGASIPVEAGSIDVAYSNQLVEHLHPEDACRQLAAVYESIAPGGVYLCVTVNRLSGPHDISKYFDETATGFHLKEYSLGELCDLFDKAGFTRLRVLLPLPGGYLLVPVFPFRWLERMIASLPGLLRKAAVSNSLVRGMISIRLAGYKSE